MPGGPPGSSVPPCAGRVREGPCGSGVVEIRSGAWENIGASGHRVEGHATRNRDSPPPPPPLKPAAPVLTSPLASATAHDAADTQAAVTLQGRWYMLLRRTGDGRVTFGRQRRSAPTPSRGRWAGNPLASHAPRARGSIPSAKERGRPGARLCRCDRLSSVGGPPARRRRRPSRCRRCPFAPGRRHS